MLAAFVCLPLLLVPLLLAPALSFPLDRDEGEYAHAADLLLAGGLPYRDTFLQKPPAVPLLYAGLFATVGDSPAVIHAGVIAAHTVAAALLGALAAELAGPIAAIVAIVLFACSLVSPLYGATSANTEAFMLVPLLGSLLLLARLARGADGRAVIVCGLLLGVAGLCKQVAAFHLPLYLVVLAARPSGRWRAIGLFGFAAAVPLGLTLAWAGAHHMLPAYLDAILWVNLEYVGNTLQHPHGAPALQERLANAGAFDLGLWLLALVMLTLLARRDRRLALGLALWLGTAIYAASSGGYWRDHYLLQILPAIAVTAAVGSARVVPLRRIALPVLAACWLWDGAWLFGRSAPTLMEQRYGASGATFVNAEPLGRWLRRWPDSSLYVFASEAELYHLSGRFGPTRYPIFTPLFGGQPSSPARQREVIVPLDRPPLPFQVVTIAPDQIPLFPGSDSTLYHHVRAMLEAHYQPVAWTRWDSVGVLAPPIGRFYQFQVFQRQVRSRSRPAPLGRPSH
jgi:4-amino-4-deoxy-L-arabinose transferase-like glycosyltransferase